MLAILISGFTKPDFLWSYLYKNLSVEQIIIFRYDFKQDLNKSIKSLDNLIKESRKEDPDLQVIVIGHSMGGLIARGASEPNLAVTIASPNSGTLWANLNPILCRVIRSASQMRTNSSFVRNLVEYSDKEKNTNRAKDTLCLKAQLDVLILPSSSAFISEATNKTISGVGHLSILLNRDTLEAIEEFLYQYQVLEFV